MTSYPPQPTSAPSATPPSYGTSQPTYGQSGYPQQGMSPSASTPYAQAPYSATPPAPPTSAKGSGKLGLFSLIASILALVIGIVLDIVGWQMLKTAIANSSDQSAVGWVWLAQMLPSALGIAAIVLGIIAIAKNSGRTLGIIGLVLSILAPMIVFGVWMATLASLAS